MGQNANFFTQSSARLGSTRLVSVLDSTRLGSTYVSGDSTRLELKLKVDSAHPYRKDAGCDDAGREDAKTFLLAFSFLAKINSLAKLAKIRIRKLENGA